MCSVTISCVWHVCMIIETLKVGNSGNKAGPFVAIDFIYASGNRGLNGLTVKICDHFA